MHQLEVLYDGESPYQHIKLVSDLHMGLVLYLDKHIQFVESEEAGYHESLGCIPFLFTAAKDVLICGGGDGLLASRILRYESVKSVTIVDIDKQITDLAAQQFFLSRLNKRSMHDPRVRVVNEDIFSFLEGNSSRYDLIISDLPDPYSRELNSVYSREFYSLCRKRLRADGTVVVQACFSPRVFTTIKSTLHSVFGWTCPYRITLSVMNNMGFVLAADSPQERKYALPAWTEFLTPDLTEALFTFAKDEEMYLSPGLPNTLENLELWAQINLHKYVRNYSYRYNERTVVLDTRRFKEPVRDDREMVTILEPLRQRNVIFHVTEDRQALRDVLEQQGFSHRTDLHFCQGNLETMFQEGQQRKISRELPKLGLNVSAYRGAPADRADLLQLVHEYIGAYGEDTLLGIGRRELACRDEALYLICHRYDGTPVGFVKINELQVKDFYTIGFTMVNDHEIEFLFTKGSTRENIGMMFLFIHKAREMGIRDVAMHVADANMVRLVTKLGAEKRYSVQVLLREAVPERESEDDYGNS